MDNIYKLVAIDVDGTLVNDDKKLSQETINSIKKAYQNNTKIVLSSARSFYRLKSYLEDLGLMQDNQYTIAFNGAIIFENKSQNVLFSNNFEEEEVNELINLADELKTSIFLYSINNVFTEKVPTIVEHSKNFKNVKFDKVKFKNINFNKDSIYKILFVDEYDNIFKMRKNLPKEICIKYSVTSSIPECIEFVKNGITKSKALDFLCKRCNIEKIEAIAIGDGDNDLEMIDYAGLGVAMGNATKLLKEKADYITTSNNDNGVARVIDKYINNI